MGAYSLTLPIGAQTWAFYSAIYGIPVMTCKIVSSVLKEVSSKLWKASSEMWEVTSELQEMTRELPEATTYKWSVE